MPTNTLRFEIKVLKMVHQKKGVGIKTMADIDLPTMNLAFEYLKKQLEKVLYYDSTINAKGLSSKEKEQLQGFKASKNWTELKPKKRHLSKLKLNQFIKTKSKNLKSELLKLLDYEREQFNQLSEIPSREQFNHSNIGLNNTRLEDRICPVTGMDISMQKEGSKLLSNTGLKHLEKTKPKEFKRLQSILLTGQHNKFERTVYDMMSKQIRNYFYGNRDFYTGPSLFD